LTGVSGTDATKSRKLSIRELMATIQTPPQEQGIEMKLLVLMRYHKIIIEFLHFFPNI
jgi:hypothetical protein